MNRISRWLRGWTLEQVRLLAGALFFTAVFVVMMLALMSGHLVVAATIGLVCAVVEVGLRWVNRVRRGDRIDRLVARLVGDGLSDAGLQQVLDCWSKRHRRQ